MDPSASGRDVLLSSVKPAFMQEQYHVNAPNNNLMQPQFLAGKAAALNAAQSRTGLGASASLGGEAANVPLDQGSTHPSYGSSGLQAMYPTANANNAMYAHPRSSSDPQIQWGYSGGGGKRHSITQKDTGFPMNPQQLTTLQNIGQISMPDSLSGTPTVGNEHALDTTFDTAQQNQPNAFTGAMFGGSDGVEVGADASNVYGVGVVAPGGTSNINMRDVGHSIPGFTGSTGLQLSGSPMRGHGQYQANPYNRGGS